MTSTARSPLSQKGMWVLVLGGDREQNTGAEQQPSSGLKHLEKTGDCMNARPGLKLKQCQLIQAAVLVKDNTASFGRTLRYLRLSCTQA
jgi:hypothetical protein